MLLMPLIAFIDISVRTIGLSFGIICIYRNLNDSYLILIFWFIFYFCFF